MSDSPRTMNVREFVRGGYKEPGPPIIVVSGNDVVLVAFPGTSALEVRAAAVTPPNGVAQEFVRAAAMAPSIRPVPKPSKRARR